MKPIKTQIDTKLQIFTQGWITTTQEHSTTRLSVLLSSRKVLVLEDQFSSPWTSSPCPWVSSPWQQHWRLYGLNKVINKDATTPEMCRHTTVGNVNETWNTNIHNIGLSVISLRSCGNVNNSIYAKLLLRVKVWRVLWLTFYRPPCRIHSRTLLRPWKLLSKLILYTTSKKIKYQSGLVV